MNINIKGERQHHQGKYFLLGCNFLPDQTVHIYRLVLDFAVQHVLCEMRLVCFAVEIWAVIQININITYELGNSISYKIACASSQFSDHPAPRSRIRVFAWRSAGNQGSNVSKGGQGEQRRLCRNLRWAHIKKKKKKKKKKKCMECCVPAHMVSSLSKAIISDVDHLNH